MRWPSWTIALLLCALAAFNVKAQDTAESIAELRARISSLEYSLNQRTAATPVSAHYTDSMVDSAMATNDTYVRSVIDSYLAERGLDLAKLEAAQQPAAG